MGASTTTAATLATVGSLATVGMAGMSAYQQASAQKQMANYNAQVANNNAQVAEWQAQDAQRRGEEEAQKVRRNADILKGSQRASMAAKGLDLAEGTAQELQDQTDFFSLTDQGTARSNAAKEAWAKRAQGANFQGEASMQRATARSINPLMSAGTSMMTSAAAVSDRWFKT